MTLGEKIKQSRLEAGLSQRQLCGGEVTRNMLSQIENGTARPSMATLAYFAARLGRPVSYFLEEDAVFSPNQNVMAQARAAWLAGNAEQTREILASYHSPDPVFDSEFALLSCLSVLDAARQALSKGQHLYAAEILDALQVRSCYCSRELERQRLLLLAKARPQLRGEVCRQLPSIDDELLLRARDALDRGELDRSAHLLEAVQARDSAERNFLLGEVHMAQRHFADAAVCYHKAEESYPEKCAIRLERCYRELEDFKQAYFYACKYRTDN